MVAKTTVDFAALCGFTDKQWIATAAANTHRYTLFGGARGPGKSYWLRWYCVGFLLDCFRRGLRGVRIMLACEDYPSLYERQLSKIQTEFPPYFGHYFAHRNEFRLWEGMGSGIIAFRNLDDPAKYQSAEYAMIAIDELTKNPEKTFHVLRASMRWPGFDGVRFVAATNPAASWVRAYWIEHRLPEELQGAEGDFAFVPALPDDNPHLPETYWQMLDTLPGAMRAAWRHGDWYAGVEGLVYSDFTEANITDEEPDKTQPIELAVDEGYIDPRATLFIQRKPGGDVLVFDELYQTKTMQDRTVVDIKERCTANGWRLPEVAVVSHEAPELRERLRQADIPARNWLAAGTVTGEKSKRLAAINRTRALICDGQGYRAIRVHRRCRNLLDEIMSGYKYPDGKRAGADDFPADGNDHAINALETWCFVRAMRQ